VRPGRTEGIIDMALSSGATYTHDGTGPRRSGSVARLAYPGMGDQFESGRCDQFLLIEQSNTRFHVRRRAVRRFANPTIQGYAPGAFNAPLAACPELVEGGAGGALFCPLYVHSRSC